MDKAKHNFLLYLKDVAKDRDTLEPRVLDIEGDLGMFHQLPGTVVYVNNYLSGKIMYSRGFDTVLGYPIDTEIDQEFILNLAHPDDSPVANYLAHVASIFHLEYYPNVKPFETVFEITYRVRKFDGSYTTIHKKSTGYFQVNGRTASNITFLQDLGFLPDFGGVQSRILADEKITRRYDRMLAEMHSRNFNSALPITKREVQVLHLMAQGKPSKAIADKLCLSVHTVNNHRKNMLRKTGLHNTAELVRYGLEAGVL